MLSQQTGRRLRRCLVSPEPYVLVQLLTKRLRPSGRVFGAEVSAEAVGGGSQGCLCAALGVRLLGVQVFLREVGVRFGKPLEVGWKDKGTSVTGLRGQRSRVWGLSLAPHSHPGGVVASTWTLGRPREAPHLSFLCEDQGGSRVLSATPALGKLNGQVRDVFCVPTSWQRPHTPEAGASVGTARPWGHRVHRDSPRAIVGPARLCVSWWPRVPASGWGHPRARAGAPWGLGDAQRPGPRALQAPAAAGERVLPLGVELPPRGVCSRSGLRASAVAPAPREARPPLAQTRAHTRTNALRHLPDIWMRLKTHPNTTCTMTFPEQTSPLTLGRLWAHPQMCTRAGALSGPPSGAPAAPTPPASVPRRVPVPVPEDLGCPALCGDR